MPDLVGVDEAVALNEISGNGWVIETERERSDEVPEIDHVVRTVPAAGEMLDEGDTFVIVVSDGFELRTLPELTGMTLAEAHRRAHELRLVPGRGARRSSPRTSPPVSSSAGRSRAMRRSPPARRCSPTP